MILKTKIIKLKTVILTSTYYTGLDKADVKFFVSKEAFRFGRLKYNPQFAPLQFNIITLVHKFGGGDATRHLLSEWGAEEDELREDSNNWATTQGLGKD